VTKYVIHACYPMPVDGIIILSDSITSYLLSQNVKIFDSKKS